MVKQARPPNETSNLVLLSKSGTERNISIAGWCVGLKYSGEKRLLYATLSDGEIDLVHPDEFPLGNFHANLLKKLV